MRPANDEDFRLGLTRIRRKPAFNFQAFRYNKSPIRRISGRRGGRVVEGAALEKRCVREGTAGSNPALSVPLRGTPTGSPPRVLGEAGEEENLRSSLKGVPILGTPTGSPPFLSRDGDESPLRRGVGGMISIRKSGSISGIQG